MKRHYKNIFLLSLTLIFAKIPVNAAEDQVRSLKAPGYWQLYTRDIFNLRTNPFVVFEKYFNQFGKKGDPVNIWIPFMKNIYIFSHPKDLKEIFEQEKEGKLIKGSIINDVQRYLLGDGVASIEPSYSERNSTIYHQLLPLYAEYFYPAKFALYRVIIENWSREFLDHMDKEIQKGQIDIEKLSLNFTMGIICRTMFGYPIMPDESDKIGEHLTVILNHIQYKMLNRPFVLPDSISLFGNSDYQASIQQVEEFIDKLWNYNRDYTLLPKYFIDLIKESNFEESVKRDQIKNVFFGGHETTAHLVAMSIYRLINHPEIAKKLSVEITKNDKYLDSFLHEVLRLDSPISIYGRDTTEEITINSITIPANSTILFAQHWSHRLEEFWENPEEFNPDRFLTKDLRRPMDSFYPFGLGQRKCLGKYLALFETKTFLQEFMKKASYLTWKVPANWSPKVRMQCTSRIEGGIPMCLENAQE